MAWESGKAMPEHQKEKISVGELTYYNSYIDMIDEYNKSISQQNNIDLTVDMKPPKDLFIEVRVKTDYGTVILPESGTVKL